MDETDTHATKLAAHAESLMNEVATLKQQVSRRDGVIETLKSGKYLQDAIVVHRQTEVRVLELNDAVAARGQGLTLVPISAELELTLHLSAQLELTLSPI